MNSIYVKYDIKYWIINLIYRFKLRLRKAKKRNVLYFVFEPHRNHPGLADRLKAVISLYNLAKANGYDFKFYFKTPFALSDYLMPKYNWEMSLSDLEYSLLDTKIINETNWHKISTLRPNKQYHCYNYAGNDIPWKFEDTGYYWHELFQELFQPSVLLRQAYEALNITDKHYVSVQFRFVNALEQFEGYTFFDNHLKTEEERQSLIQKCRDCISDIISENEGKTVYVFSDSKTFLDAIEDMPVKVLNHDNLGHTGVKQQQATTLKTFLDLYVMSQSEKIYRVRAKELYNLSCFALLASRMNNVPFIDKDI